MNQKNKKCTRVRLEKNGRKRHQGSHVQRIVVMPSIDCGSLPMLFNRSCDYRAWPIMSAKEPATRAAGTPAPMLIASLV
jgi:hypothetical protein